MEDLPVKLSLHRIRAARENWSLEADTIFQEGLHLVSGDVGSGKSTLALLMAKQMDPLEGSILHEGIQSIMLSFQFPEYHVTGLTIADECTSWGIEPDKLMPGLGLELRRDDSPLTLSRGELKRFHLACVLAKEYDLLLLDEPFSSLDCYQKTNLCKQLENRSHGITVIFSHEQAILPGVDNIWEIENGKLMDCGKPPEALKQWHHVPAIIRNLVQSGYVPKNISPDDLEEAACRTRE
jgi:energy-coupling factor transport system ATP-binding protein